MAKNVSASKFTELKGLDRIATITHEMQCIFRVISQDDVGLDGEIEVVTPKEDGKGFETRGGIIKVQAKSGSSYVKKDDGTTFATPVKEEDLKYWNECTFPVFFIVYHPDDDSLYYKEVKSYIAETVEVWRKPLEVLFDKTTDVFSAKTHVTVCEHAAISPPRLSFNDKERLYSNLLPVRKLPLKLTFAKTRRSSYRAVKDAVDRYTPPFCLHEKHLYTLSDLSREDNVLREFCDADKVQELFVEEWFADEDLRRNLVFMFNQLFGSHCYRLGLAYNPDFGRTYFPRESQSDKATKFERTWTSPRTKRDAPSRTVCQYYEYGAFHFWRHLAAEFHFAHYGGDWFLQVNPKYLFTEDGKKPCDPKLVGPYTTRLKALEHNSQVLNHVLFWGYTLAGGSRRINLTLFHDPILTIDPEPVATIADFALPLDPATYEEEASSLQLSLFDGDGDEEGDDGD